MTDHNKSVIVKFCEQYPYIAHRMRTTLHTFNESINVNPYHIEGDVWSHTMMVLKCFKDFEDSEYTKFNDIMYHVCLLHDVGKLFTQSTFKNKTSFQNHGPAGVQFAIDYVLENDLDRYDFKTLYYMLSIISNHINCFKCTDSNKLKLLLNNDSVLYNLTKRFTETDNNGRFHVDDNNVLILGDFIDMETSINIKNDYNICILSGVPGSGKDYVAKYIGYENIISYDKLRLQLYIDSKPEETQDEKELYQKAFEYCKKLPLIELLVDIVKSRVDNGIPVAICNTNLDSDTRTKLVKKLRQRIKTYTKIRSVLVANTRDNCINNDIKRSDKTVGKDVINGFCSNIQVPTMLEGFDDVCVFPNNYKIGD